MSKNGFQKKYMHPTRRKLVDMVQTGVYDKNTTIGYTKAKETHKIGDVWEDNHHKYEQKDGFVTKSGKNSDALQEIRNYVQKRSECKSPTCETIKKTTKDKTLIKKSGFCLDCMIKQEHIIRTRGFWKEYEEYKVSTNMLVYGKMRLEELNQALLDVKPYYEYINEDGSTEKWELPKSVEETKTEIQEMIDNGTKELEELETKRIMAFAALKKNNLEHYL